MKNKVMKKVLMVMLSATMLIGSASVTAFAQANENAEQTEATEQVIEEQPAEQRSLPQKEHRFLHRETDSLWMIRRMTVPNSF